MRRKVLMLALVTVAVWAPSTAVGATQGSSDFRDGTLVGGSQCEMAYYQFTAQSQGRRTISVRLTVQGDFGYTRFIAFRAGYPVADLRVMQFGLVKSFEVFKGTFRWLKTNETYRIIGVPFQGANLPPVWDLARNGHCIAPALTIHLVQ